MRGFQAEGAAPLVTGEPFPDPETKAHRDPDRQPRLVEARRGGRGRSPAAGSRAVSDDADPRRAARARPPRRRLRRAGLRGRRRRPARRSWRAGESYAGTHGGRHGHRPRPQGHRDRARGRSDRPRRHGRRRRRGRRPPRPPGWPDRWPPSSRARSGSRSRPPRPTSAPASTALGLALSLRDELDGRGGRRSGARRRGHRRGRGRRPARRVATWSSASMRRRLRRDGRAQPPGLRLHVPQRRSRTAAASARRRRPSSPASALARALVAGGTLLDGRRRAVRAGRASSRATPTTSPRRSTAASSSPAREDGRLLRRARRGRPAGRRPWSSCRRPRSRPSVARGLLPAGGPHADAAANAGRAALLVAALAGQPELLLARRPATSCTRTTASRPCRSRSRWSARCAPTGCPPIVSGAGPTVLAFCDGPGCSPSVAPRRCWPAVRTAGWPATWRSSGRRRRRLSVGRCAGLTDARGSAMMSRRRPEHSWRRDHGASARSHRLAARVHHRGQRRPAGRQAVLDLCQPRRPVEHRRRSRQVRAT